MRFIFLLVLSFSGLIFGNGVQDATTYHHNSLQQWNVAVEQINSIYWLGNERVLDVGCGDGKITALIASKVPLGSVVGLDVSEAMVQFAASQFNQINLSFVIGDGAKLYFEEAFDVVVSFSTLHWVMEQQKALMGIFKALAPGGKAYLITYGKSPMNLVALSEKLIQSRAWRDYFQGYKPQRVYFTKEEYQSLLLLSGFDQIELTSHLSETLFPTHQALFQFVKPLINFIDHLSAELQEKFLNELVGEIEALAKPSVDGSIPFQVLLLQIIAVRPPFPTPPSAVY